MEITVTLRKLISYLLWRSCDLDGMEYIEVEFCQDRLFVHQNFLSVLVLSLDGGAPERRDSIAALPEDFVTVMLPAIIAHLNFCNVLCMGLPLKITHKL